MWIKLAPARTEAAGLILPREVHARTGDTVRLRYGMGEVTLAAAGSSGDPATLLVPPSVIDRLHMRLEPVYRVRYGPGEVTVGPVVGLLLGDRILRPGMTRGLGHLQAVYPHTGGLVILMSPGGVARTGNWTRGLFYRPQEGRYEAARRLPLPAALRRPAPTAPAMAARFMEQGMRVFPYRHLSKWDQYRLARQDPVLRPHLPETARVEGPEDVTRMLERHGTVVLKPAASSRGRGISFVRQTGQGRELVPGGRTAETVACPPGDWQAAIQPGQYLCQQAIPLAEVEGRPFDIRVQIQKDGSGRWTCSGMACRLAREGSLLVNLGQGAEPLRLEEALARSFGDALPPADVRREAARLALRVGRCMDGGQAHLGELGTDLALDRQGRLWFVEVNFRSYIRIFLPTCPDTAFRIRATPWLYLSFLAGFPVSGNPDLTPARDRAPSGCPPG